MKHLLVINTSSMGDGYLALNSVADAGAEILLMQPSGSGLLILATHAKSQSLAGAFIIENCHSSLLKGLISLENNPIANELIVAEGEAGLLLKWANEALNAQGKLVDLRLQRSPQKGAWILMTGDFVLPNVGELKVTKINKVNSALKEYYNLS